MANQNDPVCKIDAGKVLAALHIAANQATTGALVVNSGIVNDSKNVKDAAKIPDNMTFDMSNSSGMYQIGVIPLKYFSFQAQIDPTKLKDIIKLENDIEELEKKSSPSSDSIKSITDKPDDADEKHPEGDLGKKLEELSNAYSIVIANDKLYKKKKMSEMTTFATEKQLFLTAVEQANEERKKEMTTAQENLRKEVFEQAKTYLTTFAGQTNASKLKPTDIDIVLCSIDKAEKLTANTDTSKLLNSEKGGKLSFVKKIDEKAIRQVFDANMANGEFIAAICAGIFTYEVEVETM